jgi:hypothetical protein
VALTKLPGVESAEVSLEKASADIRLKADNRVSIPQLRDLMKKNGYPTKDAQVVARGRILDRNGPVLDLLNGVTMGIVIEARAAAELDALRRDGGEPAVEVTGVSRMVGKNVEHLTISAIVRSER